MAARKKLAAHTHQPRPVAAASGRHLPLDPPTPADAWPFMLAVFGAVFAIYAWSAPRTIALEDDGEFVTVVYRHAVAHAPGFPLFILLAEPFSWLPIGSVAFRLHLASGVFGAGACAMLWWIVRCLSRRRDAALIAALACGVSEVFWSQSIIADVYSLNALVFFLLFALALAYCARPRAGLLKAMALVVGLGLSNHWPLFTLALPCAAIALWPVRRQVVQHALAGPLPLAALLLLGLLPYADMVIRTRLAPELTFAGPITSFSEFWTYVSRTGYSAIESDASAGASDKLSFAGFLGLEAIRQFTPFGAGVAILGAAACWRRSRPISVGLIAGFAGATFILLLQINWEYTFLWRTVFKVYPVVPYGIEAIWLGLGLAALQQFAAPRWGQFAAVAANIIGAGIVGYLLYANAAVNNRRDYTFGRDYAATLLDSFDPNAVVFARGDVDINTLFYYHFVEGRRPDIQLFTAQGLGITPDGPRPSDPVTNSPAQKQQKIAQFAQTVDRPVYFLGAAPNSLSDNEYGLYRKIDRTRPGPASTTFGVQPRFVEFLRKVMAERPTDPWTVDHRGVIIQQMAHALTGAVEFGGGAYSQYRQDLELVSGEFGGMLSRIRLLESQGTAAERLRPLVARARTLVDETIKESDLAALAAIEKRLSALPAPGR